MISIDRVYSTVLDILNKEQRGDLPPSKFNNIAHLSQLDLFNKLMFDYSHFANSPKGDMNTLEAFKNKMNVFRRRMALSAATATNTFSLPSELYMLDSIEYTSLGQTRTAQEIDVDDIRHIGGTDKTMLTTTQPKYIRIGDDVELFTGETTITLHSDATTGNVVAVNAWYIKQPNTPVWNSIDIGAAQTPLYNSATSTDFELHQSQEDELIKQILIYAGVTVRQEGVSIAVAGLNQSEEQLNRG